MSKVLFYTSEVAEKVSAFMLSIQGDQDKLSQFITFDQMATRTKVTLESSASEVVSSIVTFASLINGVNIFIPWMGLIRGSLKEYIDTHNINDVTYQIITDADEEAPALLSGEPDSTVIKVPSDLQITYDLFNPVMKRIMYIMKLSEVAELVSNITEKSVIAFSGLEDIKSTCDIKPEEQVGIAIPQLQVSSWIEMFTMLETLINTSPIDYLYLELEKDEPTDFYIDSILKLIDTDKISVVYGKRNFTINERPEETSDEKSEDVPATEEVPTVEAEVVSE